MPYAKLNSAPLYDISQIYRWKRKFAEDQDAFFSGRKGICGRKRFLGLHLEMKGHRYFEKKIKIVGSTFCQGWRSFACNSLYHNLVENAFKVEFIMYFLKLCKYLSCLLSVS